MVYNDGDQLVRWPGMYRYSYDDAGNLVQVRNDSQTQVLKSYTYTPAGLLATATFRDKDGNTRTLSNTWDADSNRVGMNANGTAYVFVYDTTAGIPAVIEESTSGSTAYYIREPGGSLIARLNATDGIRYYHFDELGSTRLLTDGSGNVTDKYAYDAYGSLLSHDCYSGSVSQPYQYVGQLGYYTHYQEPEFGLLQLGVRFYDPEVGRFGQRDPILRQAGAYTYASDEPTRVYDCTGSSPKPRGGKLPYDNPWCRQRREEIAKLKRAINAPLDQLVQDKKRLPQCCPGKSPRYSREGHIDQLLHNRKKLQDLEDLYNQKCESEPPPPAIPVPVPVPDPEPKIEVSKACVWVAVGVCCYEIVKWGAAVIAAPETCGLSICAAAATP
jgi:RHS repeat-associated protein